MRVSNLVFRGIFNKPPSKPPFSCHHRTSIYILFCLSLSFFVFLSVKPRGYGHLPSPIPSLSQRGRFNKIHLLSTANIVINITANIIKIMSRLAFDGWWCWASLGTTARDCDSADFCGLGYALSLRLWRLLVWASGISSSSTIALYYCACSSGVTVTSYSPSPFVKRRGILIHLQIKCRAIQINFPCHTNHRSLSCD